MNRFISLLFFILIACQSPEKGNPSLQSGGYYADIQGGKVWFGIMGEGDATPLLCRHGGPGGTSKSFLSLAELSRERPVILMDQLGSGLSSYHEDSTLLTVENFVEQVKAVKETLNLKEFYLMGHSWGTALALEYYSKYPDGVKGIVFNSPYFSTSTWIKDTDLLVSTLPDSIQEAIFFAETNYEFESQSYKDAMDVFFKNFLVRKDEAEWPTLSYQLIDPKYDSVEVKSNSYIYNYMWGPSEFSPTGTLLNYENIDALKGIKVPVLFTTGEYDEARPETVELFTNMVPDASFIEIPKAGHGSTRDNQPAYLKAHRDFTNQIDAEDSKD